MNWKVVVAIVLALVGGFLGASFLLKGRGTGAGPTLTLRVAVTPGNESGTVLATAQSAKFKYLAGKMAGVKPAVAQRLSVKPVPNTAIIEAQLNLPTKEQAGRYADLFLPTLQDECGTQVQLALVQRSIR